MIVDYSKRKAGVDMFDKNLEEVPAKEKQLDDHFFFLQYF